MEQVGRGIEAHGRMLFPVARSLRLLAPGGAGGLVWNRPAGMVIEEAAGVRHVRIPDRTRQIQWALLGAGVTIGLTMRLRERRESRRALPWR